MKNRPAEIKLRFKGPESKRCDAIKALQNMGFVDLSNSGASWKDSFPTLQENKTCTYLAHFNKCDREADYATVWAGFERRGK